MRIYLPYICCAASALLGTCLGYWAQPREVWLCGVVNSHEMAVEIRDSGLSISNPNPAPVSLDMHLCAAGERERISGMNEAKAKAGVK